MDEATAWEIAMQRGVQFAPATLCSTLEIDFSDSLTQPDWSVGNVNDETILNWLGKVKKPSSFDRSIWLTFIAFPSA